MMPSLRPKLTEVGGYKMKRIGPCIELILVFLFAWVCGGCSKGKNEEVSPLLAGGKKWFSEDKSYALRFPKGWVVEPLPFRIAIDPDSRTSVRTSLESAIQAKTDEEMLRELLHQAGSNAPPAIDSSGIEQLHQGTGKIAGHPAAWSALAFVDRETGARVSMAFAVGGPRGTVIIHFMLIPRDKFDQLEPVFRAIAQSLEFF
jgi:hypothetical protein